MWTAAIGIALVVGFAGVALGGRRAWDRWARKRAEQRWRACLDRLSLTPVGNGTFPGASGRLRDRPIEAWIDEHRAEGRTHQFVRVRVGVTDAPELFARARVPSTRELTWPEVRTGDPAFDERIRVNARDRFAAAAWLDPDRRGALQRLDDRGIVWSLGNGFVGLSHPRVPDEVGAMEDWVHAMVDTAEALEVRR